MADPRARRRSRSGAHTPCPHCGKKLRHDKAVAMHIGDVHPELAPAPAPAADPAEAPHGEPVEPRGAGR